MYKTTRLMIPAILGIILLLPVISFAQRELAAALPEVDGWEKGDVVKYPGEALGYSVGYQSETGGTVTIYFYHGDVKNIPNGANNKAVKAQIDQAETDIRTYADMGYYQNVKKIGGGITMLDATNGSVEAQHYGFDLEIRGAKMTSDIYLFGKDKFFVKFRATRLRGDGIMPNAVYLEFLKKMDVYFSS